MNLDKPGNYIGKRDNQRIYDHMKPVKVFLIIFYQFLSPLGFLQNGLENKSYSVDISHPAT